MQVSRSPRENYYFINIYNGNIPEDAPQEVKKILDRKSTVPCNKTLYSTNKQILNARIKMAEDIKALGYNPVDYNLDLDKLNKKLSDIQAGKAYKSILIDTEETVGSGKMIRKLLNLFRRKI